jgi:hypothetical protein
MRFMTVETSAAPEDSALPIPSSEDRVDLRTDAILARAEALDIPLAAARQMIREGTSYAQALERMIDIKAAAAPTIRTLNPIGHGTGIASHPSIRGRRSYDDPSSVRERMAGALAHKLSGGLVPLADESREFRSLSFLDMGRELAGTRGIRLRSSADVAGWLTRSGGMHTTSDFALTVADASNKMVLARFQRLSPALASTIARRTTVLDYKLIRRFRVGEGPELLEVNEAGEVKRGSTGEEGENYVLRRYARIFALTRKLIVNDDQNALADFLNGSADAAASKLGDVLTAVLLNNAVMSDGVNLFHANHGNLGTAAAISVTSLSAARLAMRNQKGVDGGPIQVVPRYLVVGSAKETEAEQVLTTLAATETGQTNPFAGKLTLVVEPRITGNKWFIFSEPTVCPVLEFAEMESADGGGPGPQIETRQGFDVEDLEVKTAYDVGAAAIGWRGAFYNPGN